MAKKASSSKSRRGPASKDLFLPAVEAGDVASVRALIAEGKMPGVQDAERAAELSNKAQSTCHQRERSLFGRLPTAKQIKRAETESLAGYQMVEAMLAAGAPAPNELCPAARAGNTRLALLLIKHGADVNYAPPMGTPLENAVKADDLEIVRALIQAGADVNHQSYLGSVLTGAAEDGRVLVAEELIRAGADVNLKPRFGQTALMKAVQNNQCEFVGLLVRHNVDVNLKDGATVGEFGEPEVTIEGGCRVTHIPNPEYLREATPLIVAVRKGFADIAAQLIAAQADLEAVDSNSLSAMAYAVRAQDQAMIKRLTEAGAKPLKFAEGSRELAWIAAAKQGDCERLRTLLKEGVDVNMKYSSSTDDTEGTALSHAADNGHIDAIRLLLKAGAKADETIGSGYEDYRKTALMSAAAKGQVKAAKELLSAGANPSAQDRGGRTVVHYAAEGGSPEIIRLLAKAGAKVDLKDKSSCSPLMQASGDGHVAAVEALMELGANVNLLSRDGFTPLWHACSNGHAEVVRLLLSGGANPNPPPPGFSALEAASSEGYQEIIDLLLTKAGRKKHHQAGTKFSVPPDDEALISAIMAGKAKIVRSLLDAGANANATMDDGHFTALMMAVRVGSLEILDLLLKAGADVNALTEERETALDLAYEGIKMAKDQLRFLGIFADKKEQREGNELRKQLREATEDEFTAKLMEAGGKRGKELKGARAPRAKPEPEDERDFEDLPLPDFRARARAPGFKEAIRELESLCAAKPKPISNEEGHPLMGCVKFQLATELADRILDEQHESLLRRGYYLLKCARGYASGKDELALLPTDQRAEVFAAFQTNGANSNVYPADIVRWFDELEQSQPFVLSGASHDWCEGRFTTPIKDSKKLAKQMCEFCPDIVTQGVGDVARLALELKKTRKFFFWWD